MNYHYSDRGLRLSLSKWPDPWGRLQNIAKYYRQHHRVIFAHDEEQADIAKTLPVQGLKWRDVFGQIEIYIYILIHIENSLCWLLVN